ncbi:MAG: hypothetical protein MPJ04_08035 [Nitrosopumilus sp.]|nr:hypothetical protein [Nitrosopumilus sp.]MDA7945671.1 hypothetical protein [Nitrosopumilus sp.]MDA7955392.1 hypothetical protein [Nitrosopumilus sp.]MDA7974390.1 hypothetical protein [Nitrosopumilus sp.]MDA7997473.1 hypothetical protein [Nitrosopumilus sp.]
MGAAQHASGVPAHQASGARFLQSAQRAARSRHVTHAPSAACATYTAGAQNA